MRVVSEVCDGASGSTIEIASEEDYFRWMFSGERPSTQTYPVHLIWVE